jgi:hypothetical protein
MLNATKDLLLPTTITGSLPRPVWYTENLGSRPFRDAMADARYREQYTDAVGTHIRRRRLLPHTQGVWRRGQGRHQLRGHGEPRDASMRRQDRVQRGGAAQLDVELFVEIFNPAQQRLFATPQSYQEALPHLARLDVDVLTFECATTDGMDLESIGRAIQDHKVAVGVVDHRNLQVERPEQVAALIRKAHTMMVSIVRGANIVRRELGLPPAECRAADPRFALAEED